MGHLIEIINANKKYFFLIKNETMDSYIETKAALK